MKTRLYHLHALSALHCGTGQSAGVVDLPIARERATKLPMVPGSSLRGVLRDNVNEQDATALFGPLAADIDTATFAGACAVGDAALLTLPVRSLAGVVCYATSPFILKRYARDLRRAGLEPPAAPDREHAAVAPDSVNTLEGKVVLEDLDLAARTEEDAREWAQVLGKAAHADDDAAQRDFTARFAILPDDVMDFLSETGTEVRARIAINPETGTVKDGALWYEENLPADSLLWGVFAIAASSQPEDPRGEDELAKAVPDAALLQLGGKAGVGRGLVCFRTSGAAA